MVVLTSFIAPTEGVKLQQPSTKLLVDGREVGVGTLYIAESELAWKNNASGEGISIQYPKIGLHAVSRDLERFDQECLYMLVTDLEGCEQVMEGTESGSDEGEGGVRNEEDLIKTTEMRFAPDDKGALDAMYQAMVYCQALNPDPEDPMLSEDEDDEEYLDVEEDNNLMARGDSGYIEDNNIASANGFARVDGAGDAEYDSAMETEPGQFEDAED